MHPGDPDTLLVAAWERQRDEYCTNDPAKRWGAGSGLYKTTDAGATFRRITEGLPTCELGRIGLDYWRKNPDVIYATVDSVRIGSTNENAAYMGITGADAEAGARLTQIVEGGPAAEAGLKVGDIVLSVDGKSVLSHESLLAELRTRSAGDTVKLTVARERQPLELEVALAKRPDQNQFPFRDRLGGQVANIHEQ
jgi:predicted metalloprotease with PDZ domain